MGLEKKTISLRYWMLGRNMHLGLAALEFASSFHKGVRKDGSPEFNHQLSIGHYVRTLINHLDHPEETLAATFLHDVCEDYDVGFDEISNKFGPLVCKAVTLLTKKHRGNKMPTEVYYQNIAENNIASVVKGGDRIHNIQTMVDVFDMAKQQEYMNETNCYVLPMLKKARRCFTTQESAYENIKLILQNQIKLIRAIHDSSKTKTVDYNI